MGVNTFCSSHRLRSLGKTLNVLPSKCPESCGTFQREVQGRGPLFVLPLLQSLFQGQCCCVCGPLSHSKSFTPWGTRERFTTELFKFCWKNPQYPPSPLSTTRSALFPTSKAIQLTFDHPPRGPRRHRQGARIVRPLLGELGSRTWRAILLTERE